MQPDGAFTRKKSDYSLYPHGIGHCLDIGSTKKNQYNIWVLHYNGKAAYKDTEPSVQAASAPVL